MRFRKLGVCASIPKKSKPLPYDALDDLAPMRVALFGSRFEPERRGGDLDLLILSDSTAFALSKRVATRFFSRCEEEIDVVVLPVHDATPEQQAFLDSITHVELFP